MAFYKVIIIAAKIIKIANNYVVIGY